MTGESRLPWARAKTVSDASGFALKTVRLPRAGAGADFLPPAGLRDLQTDRLRRTVRLAYDKVPLYRDRLTAAGIAPDDVRTVDDLARLPLSLIHI